MQTTTNYGLKMPEGSDAVNIDDINYNTALLDKKVKEVETVASNSAAVTQLQKDFNSHEADYVKHPGYVVATGSANTYAVTLNPAPTAYADGMGIVVKINVASTSASTINVNGLGAKAIKDSLGNAVAAGGLKANTPYTLRYESTSDSFIVQGKGGGDSSTEPPIKYIYSINSSSSLVEVADSIPGKIVAINLYNGPSTLGGCTLIINNQGNIIAQYTHPTGVSANNGKAIVIFTSDNGWILGYTQSMNTSISRYNSSGSLMWTVPLSSDTYFTITNVQIPKDHSDVIGVSYFHQPNYTNIQILNLNIADGSSLSTTYFDKTIDNSNATIDGYSYKIEINQWSTMQSGNVTPVYKAIINKLDNNQNVVNSVALTGDLIRIPPIYPDGIKLYNDYLIASIKMSDTTKSVYIIDKNLNIIGKFENCSNIYIANYDGKDSVISYIDLGTSCYLSLYNIDCSFVKSIQTFEFKIVYCLNNIILGYNKALINNNVETLYIKELINLF
ncbi:hypothetical protein [Clostridium sp. JS66]|uniref:hypothetical protein n=1 Tax=Clostridium sp. JS66 TaxID=3064705 RepID=UPI00298D8F94|nr:hypothetical protein [Clostridium sp. JS66]WPC40612.1 hypothetical protein Q6H37_22345 [Clostridium sp. JS66]